MVVVVSQPDRENDLSVKTSRKHRRLIQFNQRRLLARNAGGSSPRERGMGEQGIHWLLAALGQRGMHQKKSWLPGEREILPSLGAAPHSPARHKPGSARLRFVCWGQPETCWEEGKSKYPFGSRAG